MTYSIVARDPETGAFGVAVQSHFFSVGALVPWAEPDVGAVATQAFANLSFGPRGLAAMRAGASAEEALNELVLVDEGRDFRQVALIDNKGRASVRTGARCIAEAGHRIEDGLAAQGNMLAAANEWDRMVDAFCSSTDSFPERLLAALEAAEAEGGDIRGRQSAALLVVGLPAGNVELRVEDHDDPLRELRRLFTYHQAYGLLGAALLGEGLLLGDISSVAPGEIDRTLRDLSRAQETLGDNPEPTFWRAVLLTRLRRFEEARSDFEWAVERRQELRVFSGRLRTAGFLPVTADELNQLIPKGVSA